MKKIYQNPKLKVVRIQTAKMIAASPGYTTTTTTKTSGNLSRQGGFLDDEYDEE